MADTRAPKRRKLDTPEKGHSKSSPAQRTTKTPDTASKREKTGDRAQSSGNGIRPASAGQESWKQAKAKAQELRGRKAGTSPQKAKNVDVYDDIEGAHSGRSRLKPLTDSASKKKRLDPLQNQNAATPANASPAKQNGGLDFFKRFTKPRDQDETLKKEAEQHVVDSAKTGPADTPGDEGSRDEEMQDAEQDNSVTQTGKGAWKSWAYADKPKKTFEDEIRDLEKAARENAENGEDTETQDRTSPRRRGRQGSTSVVVPQKAETASKAHFQPIVTPNMVKAAKSTRKAFTDDAVPKRRKKDDKADAMDVDNELEQQLQSEIGSAAPSTTPFKQKLQPSVKKSAHKVSNVKFEAEQLQVIQSVVLQQLTSKRQVRLANLDDEYAKVSTMITQAVTAGESNSMLLIGSRGSGKTTLVNQILREQAIEHPEDFHVVRLNGFIHTDDKIALREIWRQLGREMDLDEEESNLKNYADTLTSLLALLSHPAEQGREQQQGQVTKSVIFILDEFELFASHPRQTLLYNLFDIAQSRKAPITVLGLTTRIDVAESLEKRVKSRFSHRYVHLSSAKSLVAFQEACKAALVVRREDLGDEERQVLDAPASSSASRPIGTAIDKWSSFIDTLLTQDDMTSHLQHIYYTTKSVPDFQASMILPVSAIPTDEATTGSDLLTHMIPTAALSAPDSKLTLLSSLSTLHLALLICAARLTAIHAQDTIPFVQAYEEYKSIASKAKIQASASGALAQGATGRIWSKDVARDVWAELVEMGLVMEDGARGGRVDVGLEEIGMCGVELGGWGRWCREI